ncbi:MAG: hypothetical protein ACYC6Q_09250 [Syntrophales bacterium]
MDEAMLALNILRRNFFGLISPLSHNQVAPVGFLFIEKLSILIFGVNETALRLLPLICFWGSIPMYFKLSLKLSGNKIIALIAASTFSISLQLIDYATQSKQYSVDVFVAICILYSTLALSNNDKRSRILYALMGGLAVWFSNVSIVMLSVVGCHAVYSFWMGNRKFEILLPILFWAVSFGVYYFLFIAGSPARQVMIAFWQNSFMPFNLMSMTFYQFLWKAGREFFYELMRFGPFWPVPFSIVAYGAGILFIHKRYFSLYLCLAPILLHLLLSGMKLYPFAGRLILYLYPCIIFLYAKGLYDLFGKLQQKFDILPTYLIIFPVLVMVYPFFHNQNYPIQKEETKKGLYYIQKHSNGLDPIYVYYSTVPSYEFYKETNLINLTNPSIYGASLRNHKYDQEVSRLHGKVWLIFSHVYPFEQKYNEESYVLDYLMNGNSRILDEKQYVGCSVYYIDCNL